MCREWVLVDEDDDVLDVGDVVNGVFLLLLEVDFFSWRRRRENGDDGVEVGVFQFFIVNCLSLMIIIIGEWNDEICMIDEEIKEIILVEVEYSCICYRFFY